MGVRLWHGQGPHFGLGRAHGVVRRDVALATLVAACAVITLGLVVDGR